jgi:hypothetical protein
MTSRTRLLAARLAVRTAARGTAAGNLPAATRSLMGAYDAERAERREAIRMALALARKSRLARLLNGRGDLWNGSDRSHQFALLNEAARVRRSVTLSWA